MSVRIINGETVPLTDGQRIAALERQVTELQTVLAGHFTAINTLMQTQGHQNGFNQRVMHTLHMDEGQEGNA